ncbi:hypothetical protein QAD02_017098 [Eretmocerus hayati]|uniref:Uncharacterized protein n=1 Tax=Eretmocerus hayati TaxID=131215 RepID=A0ACC2PES7_9HYME|nr:hypothetical protein QAD02_017098 [Eretmocerus hayati]
MNAFRSSGPYQMRLSGEESRKSKARLRGSLDSAVAAIEQHHRQLLLASDSNCEVSISSARASVMVYDDVNKKWVPSGSSSGLSKVQLYHHQLNNTFRVVGRKLQDHEIVMNCAILRGLKYNQATVTFHQWRDNKQVYGLNFSSKDDADAFAKAMLQALDVLSNGTAAPRNLGPAVAPVTQQQPQPQQQQQQQQQQMPVYQQQQQIIQQQPNGQYEEDMGYRTMTREDVAIIQERRMSQQNQG